MSIVHKMVDKYFDQMSPAEKELLLEGVIEKFLDELTPQEKQTLIEKMLPKLFEGVDKKELLASLTKALWKGTESDEKPAGTLNLMVKMASNTREKLSESFSSTLRKVLPGRSGDRSA